MLAPAVVSPRLGESLSPSSSPVMSSAESPLGLPDVAVDTPPSVRTALDRVGMNRVQAVASVTVDGRPALLPALCDLAVSLDVPESRGIHMSRLYLRAQQALEEGLTPARLRSLVQAMLDSHADISRGAFCDVSLTLPVRQPSLLSGRSGWRHYPVKCGAGITRDGVSLTAAVQVEYSSTCPCSAALSRDLTERAFEREFGDSENLTADAVRAWLATPGSIAGHPHSQRSTADVAIRLDENAESFSWLDLIEAAESAVQTATLGAVKREDEQEFARLNAANPMFCEDAARRLVPAISAVAGVKSYEIEVQHYESLHPHDAAATVRGEVER
ncbi:MAG: GTP cyclohydrolase FolE2 [Planctomycetota bacterium]